MIFHSLTNFLGDKSRGREGEGEYLDFGASGDDNIA